MPERNESVLNRFKIDIKNNYLFVCLYGKLLIYLYKILSSYRKL